MGLWAIDGSLGEYMGVEGSSWAYEDILRKAREYMCYQGGEMGEQRDTWE